MQRFIDRAFPICLYGAIVAFFSASWFGHHGNIVAVAAFVLLALAFVLAGLDWLLRPRRKPPAGS